MMTRKDYVSTAEILNSIADDVDFLTLANVAEKFAEMFANDNERFDHAKFIDAVMKGN
jgi:DNA-directed RNA polymerase alpha subunit